VVAESLNNVMLSLVCVSQFYLWQGKTAWNYTAKGVRYE